VVVAYDGSADAERGLEWAIRHARARRLPLEVIASAGDLEYLPERTAQEADDLVASWLDRAGLLLAESGIGDWSTTGTKERIVPALVDASEAASLVVVGAQGHTVIGGIVLGSVSQHVTRHARCPVVVVRGTPGAGDPRVVVGVDGSRPNRKALEFAFAHADLSGSPVLAVHGRSGHGDLEEAERLLAEAVAGLRDDFPDVPVELSAVPLPAVRALADASAAASLVVVGSRGRGGFAGLLLGSVSATVLQHAQCPVAVVR
jgi:nucleotide-binding universal stress UspA family protein